MQRESELEGNCRRYATMNGCFLVKWVSPGNKGVPDRILLGKKEPWFLEFKRPKTGVLTEVQSIWGGRMRRMGYRYAVIDSMPQFRAIVDG
jgi:hypothetical protein